MILGATSIACLGQQGFADRIATPRWTDFMERVEKYKEMVDRLEKEAPPTAGSSHSGTDCEP